MQTSWVITDSSGYIENATIVHKHMAHLPKGVQGRSARHVGMMPLSQKACDPHPQDMTHLQQAAVKSEKRSLSPQLIPHTTACTYGPWLRKCTASNLLCLVVTPEGCVQGRARLDQLIKLLFCLACQGAPLA